MQNSVWGVRAIELILYGLQECKEDGWEEVGDDESVGLVAFQMTQQRKFNFMHLHFDLGVKGFQRALLPASIHTSWIVSN
jgi:hypothetical protein